MDIHQKVLTMEEALLPGGQNDTVTIRQSPFTATLGLSHQVYDKTGPQHRLLPPIDGLATITAESSLSASGNQPKPWGRT